jgi:nicotinate-nucleotide adenylyltransferase
MTANCKEKIGVMGGTFDPVHYGHLFAAETARCSLGLSRVIFIPSGIPPHKKNPLMAPPEDRFAMTELAIRDNPFFEISRMELERGGPSYTADTLASLKAVCPDAELFLITGLDAALDIPNWHEPGGILSLCEVVVVARPGYVSDKITGLCGDLVSSFIILDDGMIDISATAIRKRSRAGEPIRYMTPDAVCDYVREKNLYSGAEDA